MSPIDVGISARSSTTTTTTHERVIRPLPKRQRLSDKASTSPYLGPFEPQARLRDQQQQQRRATEAALPSPEDRQRQDGHDDDNDAEHRQRLLNSNVTRDSTLPALENRSTHDDKDNRGITDHRTSSTLQPPNLPPSSALATRLPPSRDVDLSHFVQRLSLQPHDDDDIDEEEEEEEEEAEPNTTRTSLEPSISSTNNTTESPLTSPAASLTGHGSDVDLQTNLAIRDNVGATVQASDDNGSKLSQAAIAAASAKAQHHQQQRQHEHEQQQQQQQQLHRQQLLLQQAQQQQKQIDSIIETHSQNEFNLFGNKGIEIRKALTMAHLYSSAGLCGGLGLAGLHPSLPQLVDYNSGPTVAAHVGQRDDDVDEDGYYGQDSFDNDGSINGGPTQGRSNKKKRKIPGMSLGGGGGGNASDVIDPSEVDDGRGVGFDAQDGPEPATVVGPDRKGRAPGGFSRLRAPANPPRTAKAALAKLRSKPAHVSTCPLCLSHRRHLRQQSKRLNKQSPMVLDTPSTFYPPPVPRDGPPPLPPGSGLKGSKALKAAKKLEKERQKEKERIQLALGGPNLELVDLYDPDGSLKRQQSLIDQTLKTLSSLSFQQEQQPDPFELPSEFVEFEFESFPIETIVHRWDLLQDQIQQLASARKRAKQARELMQERRREAELQQAEAVVDSTTSVEVDGEQEIHSCGHAGCVHGHDKDTMVDPVTDDVNVFSDGPATEGDIAAATTTTTKTRRNSKVSPTIYTQEAPQPLCSNKKPNTKKGKKKRSAHANALNVHHRNNYVPSRVPAVSTLSPSNLHGPTSSNRSNDDGSALYWPASEQALSNDRYHGAGGGDLSWFSGPEEWMCSMCEYDLLFGDIHKVVKQRKRMLKVRKRAKQRASKATAGVIAGAASAGLTTTTTTTATMTHGGQDVNEQEGRIEDGVVVPPPPPAFEL
ncbi:hypothetical protein OIO90_004161 [Microbotryomycetes sp. JL221]|nr:hypothetical protein OIO90_004161 [Microbotryomycetes sp. JL221]